MDVKIIKDFLAKKGLPLLALGLAGLSALANNKNNEKTMEEIITKKVNEVLSNKTKES